MGRNVAATARGPTFATEADEVEIVLLAGKSRAKFGPSLKSGTSPSVSMPQLILHAHGQSISTCLLGMLTSLHAVSYLFRPY